MKNTSIDIDSELMNRALARALSYGIRTQKGTVHFALSLLASSRAGANGGVECGSDNLSDALKSTMDLKKASSGEAAEPKRLRKMARG